MSNIFGDFSKVLSNFDKDSNDIYNQIQRTNILLSALIIAQLDKNLDILEEIGILKLARDTLGDVRKEAEEMARKDPKLWQKVIKAQRAAMDYNYYGEESREE